MISCVIPLGKDDKKYVDRCIASIPDDVEIVLVDDSPTQMYKNEKFNIKQKNKYEVYAEPSDYYRAADAINYAIKNMVDPKADIVGIVDEDTEFNVDYDEDMKANCIIPADGFFPKMERLLSKYYNLVVFGMRVDTDFDRTFKKQRFTHPDIVWSTESKIDHAWNLMHADGTVFIRKDFLDYIGGYPEGIGYGEEKPDLCRRAIRNGGVVGIFRDLPYFHNMHGWQLWRVSTDLPCNPELYRSNSLVLV